MNDRPLLRLGSCDADVWPSTLAEQIHFKQNFLAKYHAAMSANNQKKLSFREEKDNDNQNSGWRAFQPVPGKFVRELQDFLIVAGFLPATETHGVFSYRTQAGARLFQEYVRTMEGRADFFPPDGLVGNKTWAQIDRWKEQGLTSEWAGFTAQNPSPEYSVWLGLLAKAKSHYQANIGPVLQHVETLLSRPDAPKTGTRKIADWKTDADTIHFIGLRRNEHSSVHRNDDLYVLLIRGLAFKFFGSTDPQVDESHGKGRPFLTEGQHAYHFGWHKIHTKSGHPDRVYRALKPSGNGVLVFRDRVDFNGSLSTAEIARGLDPTPNPTINIHWAGMDASNFSAGCQVIAGLSYINHLNKLQDCSAFAARSYRDLAAGKTRGAYNIFTDLLLCFSPPGVQEIAYTLGRDESLFLSDQMGEQFAAARVNELRHEMQEGTLQAIA